jgi:hypothetical protein
LVDRIWRVAREADAAQGVVPDFSPEETDSVTIERLLLKKRGSWFQVPHDLKPTDR